ncbi:hypothetical protein BBG47_27810 [Paenibacillus sp. KS1]|nr:hypothetical protein BBG47_27810 [Paenibacillus sp. KS1]
MKDWREELQSRPAPQKQVKSPHLCNCMAAMKDQWILYVSYVISLYMDKAPDCPPRLFLHPQKHPQFTHKFKKGCDVV